MSCFWFGHRLPASQDEVKVQIIGPTFKCRRCGRQASWDNMPKAIRDMRTEYFKRMSREIGDFSERMKRENYDPMADKIFIPTTF